MTFFERKERSGRRGGECAVMAAMLLFAWTALVTQPFGQTEMKRNRGESYYRCLTSNTAGSGNLWLSLSGIGHVWDDSPTKSDLPKEGFWMSNFRAFPETRIQAGLLDFAMVSVEARPLSWHFAVPGWASGDLKLTWPNNKNLRLWGFGLDCKYLYNFINTTPTLGGYIGFMPEGYVALGSVIETKLLCDVDLISKITVLPLRIVLNLGIRNPLDSALSNNYQFLGDVGLVYSGYDFDFFTAFSIEAFNNFTEPKLFVQKETAGEKRFLVWFRENPMYLILGGNVRYPNGMTLSVSAPLLLSMNVESKMSRGDQKMLDNRRADLFPYEVAHGIRDPFDPWFVKWKIAGSFSFPIRYKMTSAEMMRNFLLLKNVKQQNRLDIDNRLRNFEQTTTPEAQEGADDEQKRLEEIKKRKEEMQKQE